MPADASLLQKETALEEPLSSCKKRRASRSLDEAVNKALADNFKGWSPSSFDLVLRNGRSLRECIYDAKRKQLDDGRVMGKHFYTQLRELYADEDTPAKRMKIVNPDEPMLDAVAEAISGITHQRCDKRPMLALFEADISPNQKNACAIFRATLEVQPHVSQQNSDFCISCCAWAVRTGIHTKYEDLWKEMKPHFDRALEKNWLIMKANGLSAELWADVHEPYLHAILPAAALKKCVQVKTSWHEVADELAEVCATFTGSRIFWQKYRNLLASSMSVLIDQEISSLAGVEITAERVRVAREAISTKCVEAAKDMHESSSKREVTIWYRGVALAAVVSSVNEELNLKVAAAIKTRAVDSKQLASLWCEDELVPSGRPKPEHKVDASLLREGILARNSCNGFLPEGECATGLAIKNALLSKQRLLVSIDKTWKVEELFFESFIGEAGERRLREITQDCLPTSERVRTVEECLGLLQNIEDSKIYQFVGSNAQNIFAHVKNMVYSIKQHRSPTFPAGCPDYISVVKERLANFCTVELPNGSDDKKVLFGKPAIIQLFAGLLRKSRENENLVLADLTVFHTFRWLLSPAQDKDLEKFTTKVMGSSSAVPEPKSKAAKTDDAKNKSTAEKAKQQKAAVDGFFK